MKPYTFLVLRNVTRQTTQDRLVSCQIVLCNIYLRKIQWVLGRSYAVKMWNESRIGTKDIRMESINQYYVIIHPKNFYEKLLFRV